MAGSNSALSSSGLPPAFLCPAVQRAGAGGSQSQSRPAATRAVSTVHAPARAAWGPTRGPTRGPWTACSSDAHTRGFASATASAALPQDEEQAAPAISFQQHTGPEDDAPSHSRPAADGSEENAAPKEPRKPTRRLPLQCPGCGAFTQTVSADKPGYFDLSRHSTQEYLGLREPKKSYPERVRADDLVVQEALRRLELEAGGQNSPALLELGTFTRPPPRAADDADDASADKEPEILCVRCHELVHHHAGTPIFHPGIDAIRETIAESPYKYNHVYHVLDAADFPMSLLPHIHDLLDTMPLRSRNRRARHGKFYGGRKTELSFVITRADLFAPRKEQVDRLMPWIRETLRRALGRYGREVRLGNIRCVSARRNWWTSELREEIYNNGGANWLVGKANVGKSYLVHHVFPKGRMDAASKDKNSRPAIVIKNTLDMRKSRSGSYGLDLRQDGLNNDDGLNDGDGDDYDAKSDAHRANILADDALLPPKPAETNYPQMPVVSALPGTTASPIRIPFGGGKGELIDLPGLARTALTDYVQEAHRDALVMKLRVQPEQVVLTGTWHSLLLGGFIRITPRTPDLVFLTYNFTPLHEHRTGTDTAIGIQKQTSDVKVDNIAVPGTGDTIQLAGSFQLKYDVTKQRAGPITRKDAVNIDVERLPYRVVAIDLLIEGCGWVEVVAQVRTRHLFNEDARKQADARKREARDRKAQVNQVNAHGILESLDLSDPADPADPADDDTAGDDADPFAAIAGFDTKTPSKKASKASKARKETAKADNAIKAEPKALDEPEEPEEQEPEPNWPVIDVFSPGGKFIGSRPPMNAWLLMQPKAAARKKAMQARPRKSMKGAKKREKAARREAQRQSA